jgi:hypothetical protein
MHVAIWHDVGTIIGCRSQLLHKQAVDCSKKKGSRTNMGINTDLNVTSDFGF